MSVTAVSTAAAAVLRRQCRRALFSTSIPNTLSAATADPLPVYAFFGHPSSGGPALPCAPEPLPRAPLSATTARSAPLRTIGVANVLPRMVELRPCRMSSQVQLLDAANSPGAGPLNSVGRRMAPGTFHPHHTVLMERRSSRADAELGLDSLVSDATVEDEYDLGFNPKHCC